MSAIISIFDATDDILGLVNPNKRAFVKGMRDILVDTIPMSRIPELSHLDLIDSKIVTPIPAIEINTKNISFVDICDARAIEILELSKTKPTTISWSGGIDSTVILVSLLKNGYDKTVHNINVFTDQIGIDEYPLFYNKFVLGNFEVVSDGYDVIMKDRLLCTGDPGDQIFGSAWCLNLMKEFGDTISKEPYEVLHQRLAAKYGVKSTFYFNHFRAIIPYCPFKIKTVEDFSWWWNFSQKWNHCNYRTLLGCSNETIVQKNLIGYFDNDLFQIWSMLNPELKMKDGLQINHKAPAKEYIIEYTKDSDYWFKLKVASFALNYEKHNNIGEDWNPIDYQINHTFK